MSIFVQEFQVLSWSHTALGRRTFEKHGSLLAGALACLFTTSFQIVPHWILPHMEVLGYLPLDVRTAGLFF